jgi:anti-sigma B factor antagonist
MRRSTANFKPDDRRSIPRMLQPRPSAGMLSSICLGAVVLSKVVQGNRGPETGVRFLNITTTELPGEVICVGLEGRLDAAAADQIGLRFTAATAARGRPVVVDLSSVSFIGSLGLRLFIASARSLAQKGVTMVLFGANEQVDGVLRDAAIDQLIPCVSTQTDAVTRAAA